MKAKKAKRKKLRVTPWDGIYVCLNGKPLRGPFDTWKDADICAEIFEGFTAQTTVISVQKFRRGVWIIGPRP